LWITRDVQGCSRGWGKRGGFWQDQPKGYKKLSIKNLHSTRSRYTYPALGAKCALKVGAPNFQPGKASW
jgi:hypothetical protein